MANIIATTFRLRRGLAEVWARNNPVLQSGEPGFELDTNRLKIGNGEVAWNDLPYINNDEIEISLDGKSIIVNGLGEISIAGFEEAQAGQYLTKNESGELEWVKPKIEDLEQTETICLFGGSATELI